MSALPCIRRGALPERGAGPVFRVMHWGVDGRIIAKALRLVKRNCAYLWQNKTALRAVNGMAWS